MRATPITDLYLQKVDGQLVYVDHPNVSLGVITTPVVTAPAPIISPTLAANITSATNVLNSVNSAIPGQPVQIQTKFSKVMNTVASLAGTVAAVAAVVGAMGGPVSAAVGAVVAVVAAVVAAVAAILGKIFARAKAKEYDAERAQWDAANAKLREENAELDAKYETLKVNMASLRVQVSNLTGINFSFGKDNSVQGLGFCIFNCKAKAAKQNLNTSKQQYESLKAGQDEKIKLCMELFDEWDILTKAVIDLKDKGKTNAMILIGFGLAAAIGTFAVIKK